MLIRNLLIAGLTLGVGASAQAASWSSTYQDFGRNHVGLDDSRTTFCGDCAVTRPLVTLNDLPSCVTGLRGTTYIVSVSLLTSDLEAARSSGYKLTCNGTDWIVQNELDRTK